MVGGRGRTRTYEGIASGFTVRPLCRSGHSPPKPWHRVDLERQSAPPRVGRELRVLWGGAFAKSMERFRLVEDNLQSRRTHGIKRRWHENPGSQTHARDANAPKDDPAYHVRDSAPSGHAPDGPALLYGWHTVKAALENPARRIRRLLATENALRRLADDGVSLPVKPELVRPDVIDARLGPDAVHQGLLAEADPLPAPSISELASEGIVLVLDQITDPHNVGAILRSAAAFAVKAIITTARHSPEATGVLAKSASGALELVPLVTVQNLARGMEELRQHGFMLVGLDSGGDSDLADVALRAPLALVFGAEGKGLRQLRKQPAIIFHASICQAK